MLCGEGNRMRRREREIKDFEGIEAVMRKALVRWLGLSADNEPYVVPLCFAYRERTVYLHSAFEGRKVEMLGKNPRVCMEFDIDQELVPADKTCSWEMRYRRVIAFGKASVVRDSEEKKMALEAWWSTTAVDWCLILRT
jgi:nitroimidazol reductase NimA-like FMN-containing flavoprotein (pyridoxamine 5'-phosphate oxidase superfamily)